MTALREAFEKQAESCADLGSAFTAGLLRLVGARLEDNHPVGAALFRWPFDTFRSGAVALRLAGALHSLILLEKDPALAAVYPPNTADPETLWQAVDRAMHEHSDHILRWMESAPQTNEIRRSAALIPAFHLLAEETGLPLLLSEIGASAGLNLNWDAYGLEINGQQMGPKNAAVRLRPDWLGTTPPRADVHISGREGCDINPLDPCNEADRLRLLSYIWPDQRQRIANTKHALTLACKAGHRVAQEDALAFLARRLAPVQGNTRVIYHSIMWQYLSPQERQTGADMIGDAGAQATPDAPLAWLRVEADKKPGGAGITLTLWPDGRERHLGRMDFHGRWVKWAG